MDDHPAPATSAAGDAKPPIFALQPVLASEPLPYLDILNFRTLFQFDESLVRVSAMGATLPIPLTRLVAPDIVERYELETDEKLPATQDTMVAALARLVVPSETDLKLDIAAMYSWTPTECRVESILRHFSRFTKVLKWLALDLTWGLFVKSLARDPPLHDLVAKCLGAASDPNTKIKAEALKAAKRLDAAVRDMSLLSVSECNAESVSSSAPPPRFSGSPAPVQSVSVPAPKAPTVVPPVGSAPVSVSISAPVSAPSGSLSVPTPGSVLSASRPPGSIPPPGFHLPPEEMERRRSLGLCFICGSAQHRADNCPKSKLRSTFREPPAVNLSASNHSGSHTHRSSSVDSRRARGADDRRVHYSRSANVCSDVVDDKCPIMDCTLDIPGLPFPPPVRVLLDCAASCSLTSENLVKSVHAQMSNLPMDCPEVILANGSHVRAIGAASLPVNLLPGRPPDLVRAFVLPGHISDMITLGSDVLDQYLIDVGGQQPLIPKMEREPF